MTLQFEALPVGRGDAFLLRDGEHAFLFDGGQYYQQAATFLKERSVSRLDVVVCSHNDSDHANGLIGLLESSINVSEVWVPATWHDFLSVAAHKPCWPHDLLCEVEDDYSILERWSGGESARDEKTPTHRLEDQDDNAKGSEERIGEFLEVFGEQTFDDEDYYLRCQHVYHRRHLYFGLGNPVWGNIVRAGNRIIQILDRAWNKGCTIRFFKYGNASNNCVGSTAFIPLNCNEITRFRTSERVEPILYLTIQNRESLVFKYVNGGCILFTADSDLNSVNPSLPISALVTAPHHGSADNNSVYSQVQGQDLVWVRSDWRSKKRPCLEYKKIASRYCTICSAGVRAGTKQPVLLDWNGNCWNTTASRCTC